MRQLKLVFIATIAAYLSTCPTFAYGKKTNDKLQFTQGTIVFSNSDSAHNAMIAKDANKLTRQQNIVYFLCENIRDTLTANADEIKYFSMSGTKYLSIPIKTSEGTKRVFTKISRRNKKQTPILYKIYLTEDKYEVFMAEAEGMPAVQITEYHDLKDATLTDYLLAKNNDAGGNEEIASKIKNMKPTNSSINIVNNLIECQNPNRIPQTRWGAGIGVSIGNMSLTPAGTKSVNCGSSISPEATIFADFRDFTGVSFHPEISFYKVSCKYKTNALHAQYERTAIEVPLMLRYTFISMRGKWLPYVQAGLQPSFNIRDECTERVYVSNAGKGNSVNKYSNNILDISFIGGAGLEYRKTKKHSLFFEVKYAHQVNNNVRGEYILFAKVDPLTFNISYNF